MKITYFGAPEDQGAGWAWTSASEADGKMTPTAAEPGRRLAYDLFLPDLGTTFSGDPQLAAGARRLAAGGWRLAGTVTAVAHG